MYIDGYYPSCLLDLVLGRIKYVPDPKSPPGIGDFGRSSTLNIHPGIKGYRQVTTDMIKSLCPETELFHTYDWFYRNRNDYEPVKLGTVSDFERQRHNQPDHWRHLIWWIVVDPEQEKARLKKEHGNR
jgi:hypothetical protein